MVQGNILSLQRCAQGSKTKQNVVHVCTMQLRTRCPIAHSTYSSPPAPRDRLLTHIVTCANRVDGGREEARRCRAELFLGRQKNCARDWLPLILCTEDLTCVRNCV